MATPAYGSLTFAEQIDFFRRKVNLPTQHWTDLWQSAHDRAFVVAGAMQADLLADLHAAVLKGIEQGTTLETFRQDFEALVARRGWTGWTGEDTAGGRAWRARVIYETNLRSSYAAGRWAQIQQVKSERPYLLYRHNDNVLHPRPLHQAWDGKVIAADDPWWQTHYPPNGWGCQCTAFAVDEEYLRRQGKAGPDPAPDDGTYNWLNPKTGQPVTGIPNGIDPGWAYTPGASLDLADFVEGKVATLPGALGKALSAAVASPPVAPKSPTWTMLEGGAADLDEIKRLGGDRLDELLALVTPDDRALFGAIVDRNQRVSDLIASAKTHLDLTAAASWWRGEVMKQLAAARKIGGVAPSVYNKSGKGLDFAKRVASKLPDEWQAKANAHGPVRVIVDEKGRGVYYERKYNKGVFEHQIKTRSGSTTEHEWMHYIQHADPELDALFQIEHRRRTAGDPLEPVYSFTPSETGRRDKYVEPYQGREYAGKALEVITMAYQALLGEDSKATLWLAAMLKDDQEMLKLVLGALFHYRPAP